MCTGAPIATPAGVGEWPTAAAFTPGGDKVASAFAKAGIRIWDARDGRQTLAIDGARASLAPGAFNASAQLLAVTTARGAEVWDFADRAKSRVGRRAARTAQRSAARRRRRDDAGSRPKRESNCGGSRPTPRRRLCFRATNDQSAVRAFRLSHNGALAAAYLETGGRTDKILVWDARTGASDARRRPGRRRA